MAREMARERDLGEAGLGSFAAVILAGGRSERLGGFDKGSAEIAGRTLLMHTLDAVIDAAEVVVVGPQVPTDRPVTFVIEDPRYGGPVAGLLTGLDSLLRSVPRVAVLAVDMPRLTTGTLRRLLEAAEGADGAMLVSPEGRRQLAFVIDRALLEAADPGLEGRHGMPVHRLLEGLDLREVPAVDDEHRDVDTWADLRDLRSPDSSLDH